MNKTIDLAEIRRKEEQERINRDFPESKCRPFLTMIACRKQKAYIRLEDCMKCEHFVSCGQRINQFVVVCNYESE